MKNKCLFLLWILMLVNQSYANVYEHETSVSVVTKNIPQLGSISCRFKQEKYLNNVSKPLFSEGNFKYIKNNGVYFETTYPIKSKTSYTNRDYKQINDVIQAISNKKYTKLEKEFKIFFEKNNKIWTLGLIPTPQSKSYDFVDKITIYGHYTITKIIINLKNGNKTILCFSEK